jgi:flagellar protein FliO/FliZ
MPTSIARSFHPRHALATAIALMTAPAYASPPEAPSFVADLLAVVLPLVFVIAGLLVVLRVARKRFGITGQDAPLSILQILPVGPRERVVLLRTRADRVIAIGVCPTSISLVAQLDAADVAPVPVDPDAEPESTPNPRHRFESLLANVARKGVPFRQARSQR